MRRTSLITLIVVGLALARAESAPPLVADRAPPPQVPGSWQTMMLAPASSLSGDRALLAATVMSHTVAGTVIYRVTSTGSMRPLFDGNAVLLAEPAPFDTLQVGDIVTYLHPGRSEIIVHRIFERQGDGFWTKGDHNPAMDDVLVTRANYLERVYAIIYGQREPVPPREQPEKSARLAGADAVAE